MSSEEVDTAELRRMQVELVRLHNRNVILESLSKRFKQEDDAFDNLCEDRDRWKSMYYTTNDARLVAVAENESLRSALQAVEARIAAVLEGWCDPRLDVPAVMAEIRAALAAER